MSYNTCHTIHDIIKYMSHRSRLHLTSSLSVVNKQNMNTSTYYYLYILPNKTSDKCMHAKNKLLYVGLCKNDIIPEHNQMDMLLTISLLVSFKNIKIQYMHVCNPLCYILSSILPLNLTETMTAEKYMPLTL